MRNRHNSYDRTGSSQDFSNNEGFHNYQDRTERDFKNTPHYADRQKSQRDEYRNDRSDYRSDYRAGSQTRSEWNRPSLQNSDRFESQQGSDWNQRSGRDWNARSDYNSSRFGNDYTSRQQGADYGTGSSPWRDSQSQQSQFSPSSNSDASMSGYGADIPRTGPNSYGQGSYQSDRFDARYNGNYGYGAQSSMSHDNEPSRYGMNESRQPSSSSSGNFSWQSSSQSRQGLHSGKGPKGYRRSDDRIREDVCEALSAHSEIDASEIEVDVKEGVVTLSGTVESRQIKRIAEDAAEGLSGVSDVKNDLRVMASADSSSRLSDSDSSTRSSSSSSKANLAGRQSTSSQTSTSKSVQ